MLTSSLSIRCLFNNLKKNEFFLKKLFVVQYQTKANIIRPSIALNSIVEPVESNENQKELGLFKLFNISQKSEKRLKSRGIEYLFPVQYKSFNEIMSGKDCIVQARTGTGKTLAFTLPIIERLETNISNAIGRYPRCLVLEPTRELAKQITNDFLSIKSRFISISTIYGGKEYARQESSLKKGSDIVVGTPGRIKDFIKRNILILNQCQILVLDEVDRILDMGFQDDVDFIIQNIFEKDKKCQVIVFSATIPHWLNKTLYRYIDKNNSSFIKLIGDKEEKTAKNVEHYSLELNNIERRPEIISKLFEKYSKDVKLSKAIVFCQTKQECNVLFESLKNTLISSDVLHGDLSQKRREIVLNNFRQGKITLLITTDLSARGLDIPLVDLVILTSPPEDWESYIHRSGRTGRAEKQGKAITIYNRRQLKQLKNVQLKAKIKFNSINPDSLDSFSQ